MKLFLINPLTGLIDTKYLSLKKARELSLVVYRTFEEAYLAQATMRKELEEVTPKEWYQPRNRNTSLDFRVQGERQKVYDKYCGNKDFYTTYS